MESNNTLNSDLSSEITKRLFKIMEEDKSIETNIKEKIKTIEKNINRLEDEENNLSELISKGNKLEKSLIDNISSQKSINISTKNAILKRISHENI